MRATTCSFALILIVAVCVIAGCSSGSSDLPPLGEVSGTVTLDGAPVAGAEVTFVPGSGSPSVGKTDGEGHYTLAYVQETSGAEIGKHTVQISKYGEAGSANDTENQLPAKYSQGIDPDGGRQGGARTRLILNSRVGLERGAGLGGLPLAALAC